MNLWLTWMSSQFPARAAQSMEAPINKGVAVFTVAKGGLMYEASIGGQKFSYKRKQ